MLSNFITEPVNFEVHEVVEFLDGNQTFPAVVVGNSKQTFTIWCYLRDPEGLELEVTAGRLRKAKLNTILAIWKDQCHRRSLLEEVGEQLNIHLCGTQSLRAQNPEDVTKHQERVALLEELSMDMKYNEDLLVSLSQQLKRFPL